MQIYRFILNSVLTGAFICLSAGCTTTGVKLTSLTKDMKKNPKSFRPYSVEFEGELTPSTNIKDAISGNTLVLTQPWINLNKYELRETAVYFDKNGTASSELWLDIPWSIRGNQLCMTGENIDNCYSAYTDSTGQAFLRVESSQLLARVTSIETGDSHNSKAAYQARQEQLKLNQEMKLMFAGLLFEAFTSGGGGSAGYDNSYYQTFEYGHSPSTTPAPAPMKPYNSFYDCINGC